MALCVFVLSVLELNMLECCCWNCVAVGTIPIEATHLGDVGVVADYVDAVAIGAIAIGAVAIGAMGCFLFALEQCHSVGVVVVVVGVVMVGGVMIPSELELRAVELSGFEQYVGVIWVQVVGLELLCRSCLRCGTCYVGVHSVMVRAMGFVQLSALEQCSVGVAAVCV